MCVWYMLAYVCFFFKQKTAYEMRISDWSSDVCSSDLTRPPVVAQPGCHREEQSEERQQRGTAAGKIAVQRPQETLRHRLALGYESCDPSRHYVPPDLLI